jgi:rubrerythrin
MLEEKMSLLSSSEVLQFAVQIEENGRNFYRSFAEKFNSKSEKEVFTYLADEEENHIRIFSGMLKSIEKYEPATSYPDEYFGYLKAYADNLIFTKDKLEKEVEKIKSGTEAADFGIRRELDSILYYQEIKSYVPEEEKSRIDLVISQERLHFMRLTKLKKML